MYQQNQRNQTFQRKLLPHSLFYFFVFHLTHISQFESRCPQLHKRFHFSQHLNLLLSDILNIHPDLHSLLFLLELPVLYKLGSFQAFLMSLDTLFEIISRVFLQESPTAFLPFLAVFLFYSIAFL